MNLNKKLKDLKAQPKKFPPLASVSVPAVKKYGKKKLKLVKKTGKGVKC